MQLLSFGKLRFVPRFSPSPWPNRRASGQKTYDNLSADARGSGFRFAIRKTPHFIAAAST